VHPFYDYILSLEFWIFFCAAANVEAREAPDGSILGIIFVAMLPMTFDLIY